MSPSARGLGRLAAAPLITGFVLGAAHIGAVLAGGPATAGAPSPPGAVSARGRLEPKDGVVRVAGPSDFVAVVARLEVAEGDRVRAGQVLAGMDTRAIRHARMERLAAQVSAQEASVAARAAELENVRAESARRARLCADGVVSDAECETWRSKVAVAVAALDEARAILGSTRQDLKTAQAEREMAFVRSPISGQVLEIHTRAGEKVGADGIVELARTDAMYAVAEVYETDVTRVKTGQRAVVTSPALARPLTGRVERIALKVGKLDALGTDPAARTDARVVEVEIRLDDSAAAAALTNLEVDVLIEP
ncbi:MAG TPA: efflux RND transporter periplasmic adaptor subunit [Vicinamibacteria bacterium]|nr:efflux RND transporter periplasmic adaptor subunit [Vicinamibacteria bacterium]